MGHKALCVTSTASFLAPIDPVRYLAHIPVIPHTVCVCVNYFILQSLRHHHYGASKTASVADGVLCQEMALRLQGELLLGEL